jgi:hypothetical protein
MCTGPLTVFALTPNILEDFTIPPVYVLVEEGRGGGRGNFVFPPIQPPPPHQLVVYFIYTEMKIGPL